MFFADDLTILGSSWENVSKKYGRWKEALESRDLKVNINYTTAIKVSERRAKGPVSKIDSCSICGERIKINVIKCTACKAWVHKRCSGVRGALRRVKDDYMNVDVVTVFTMMKRK